jgi:hypothetical protein
VHDGIHVLEVELEDAARFRELTGQEGVYAAVALVHVAARERGQRRRGERKDADDSGPCHA